MLIVGPWSVTVAGVAIRMTDPRRALFLLALGGLPFLWWTRGTREALGMWLAGRAGIDDELEFEAAAAVA